LAQVTVSNQEYTLTLRALNGMAGAASALGFGLGELDPDRLIGAACKAEGLEHMGDPSFRQGLERLVTNIDHSNFSHFARILTRQSCIHALRNRLRCEAYIQKHPEVLDIPIERPLFVLGFPRTGTTLLQNLIGQANDRRALRFWELNSPTPVHEDPVRDQKQRMASAERVLRAAYFIAPEMGAVHEVRADTVEECWPLFFNNFSVMNYDLQSGLTDYGAWLLSQDMTGPYGWYKRQLQVMQHHQPGKRLILKCPEHLWFLNALFEVFPDAGVVWTHRDPYASVASYCSMISIAWRMLYGRFDPHVVGQHIEDRFLGGVTRAMEARTTLNREANFFDVSFPELVTDPKQVVHDIYKHFDLPTDAGLDDAMTDWLESKRTDKRGAHKYSADRYGLDKDTLHARYSTYIERFSIQT